MKLWLFGTYKWQGNPKALFIYMNKYYKKSHEVWWIADNEKDANDIKSLGYKATYLKSKAATYLFKNADVYVNENFRQTYPKDLNSDITILNLWHGVGIKHIELGLGMSSTLNKDIIKKYVLNSELYKNNVLFLSTSPFMDEHFTKDTLIDKNHLIQGPYPRNVVYKDNQLTSIEQYKRLDDLGGFNRTYLFAPTYRYKQINGVLKQLIPDIEKLQQGLSVNNSCMIIKVHPFMTKDPEYEAIIQNEHLYPNIIFWDDHFDVYEVFNKIDVGIIDYSSIFYDMLESGINKFIRYIPDYEEYVNDSELIDDYFENTDGTIAESFEDVIDLLDKDINDVTRKEELVDKFFKHGQHNTVDNIIEQTDAFIPKKMPLQELHTFDIFDTLIRRKTLDPKSIFFKVQRNMSKANIEFPIYLQERYAEIRHQVEMDLRDVFRKTEFERKSDKLEITLYELLERLQDTYNLTKEQVDFLYENEIEEEIECVEPLYTKIEELFELKEKGKKVLLLSDMYLPKDIIRKMLVKVDNRFSNIELYTSSDIGHQKSTGKLYEYIFFDFKPYCFSSWIHHGDNNHADGNVPRMYGIKTINHDMDTFIPFEKYLIDKSPAIYKWDSYKIATAIQRYRWSLVNSVDMEFNKELYYSFAYIGTAFVPYVHWTLKHAMSQGYKDLYFISRDGYFLKKIADVLINKLKLPLKTKYIYGSRKSWRVASFVNEIDPASFAPFGMFSNIETFEDLIASSQLEEEELIRLVPELEQYKYDEITETHLIQIRNILSESQNYQDVLLQIASRKRKIVREYLQQNIDFSRPFAFVEFWGRGYTQDTLTRLLEDATTQDFINPFYYIRNFTPNYGKSIRHRFTAKPSNFSYFESIFSQTPHQSIPGYDYDANGNVVPVIIPKENEFHEKIGKGLEDFAKVYAELSPDFEEEFERSIAEASYTYQFANPSDYYIANVFSRFKDNLAMYGEVREFAPEISESDIKQLGIANISTLTRNLAMSAARSSKNIRNKINQQFNRDYKKASKPFLINNLNKYIGIETFPKYVCSLKEQSVFQNVNWSANSKSNQRIKSGEIVKVYGFEWTHSGVPRLRIENGFLTASKEFVSKVDDLDKVFSIGTQPIYRTADLSEQINTAIYGEELSIIGANQNEKGDSFLLTNKGYVEASNDKLSTNKLLNKDTDKLKYSFLKGKHIILKNTDEWHKQPFYISEKVETSSEDKIFFVEDIVKGIDGKEYMKINDLFVLVYPDSVIELHKNYKNYIYNLDSPYVETKANIQLFNSIIFKEETKSGNIIPKFTTLKIEGIEWLENGVPRLKVNGGYISANRKFVISKEKPEKVNSIIKKTAKKSKHILFNIMKKF